MKQKKVRTFIVTGMMLMTITSMLAGCGGNNTSDEAAITDELAITDEATIANDVVIASENEEGNGDIESLNQQETIAEENNIEEELEVTFGYEGSPYTLHLYDNTTADAIAGYVGTADWNLPIYHFDDYEGWEYFQYYDIPSRYEIPSNTETITSAKAGEVYYSEPNRIILFYGDAEISEEYTPVGYIEYSEDFVEDVENNPVLEGWGNKIVSISPGK